MENITNSSTIKKYKYCIVPLCKTTSSKTPEKLWFSVPKNNELRKKWCAAMHRDEETYGSLSNLTSLFCCEDHFILEEDMENYWEFKLTQHVTRLRLKPNVVPHIFACQNPKDYIPENQYEIKQKRLELIRQAEEDVERIAMANDPLNPLVQLESDDESEEEIRFRNKGIQVTIRKKFRSKAVNVNFPNSSFGLTPTPRKPSPPRQMSPPRLVSTEGRLPLPPMPGRPPTKYILLVSDTPTFSSASQTFMSPVMDGLGEYSLNVEETHMPKASTEQETALKECLFTELITNESEINLPSGHWIICKNENQSNLSNSTINIIKLVSLKGREVIEKQMNLTKNSIRYFIFNYLHNSSNYDEIQSVEALEVLLKKFDEQPVCYGGVPLSNCSRYFRSKFYNKDSVSDFLRHIFCNYTTTSVDNRTCKLCKRSFTVLKARNLKQCRQTLSNKAKVETNKLTLNEEGLENVTIKEERLEDVTIKEELNDIAIKTEDEENVRIKVEPMDEEPY